METQSRLATKGQVNHKAEKMGVEVSDDSMGEYYEIFLYTEKGKRFKATDCHTAVTSFHKDEGTKAEAWGHCMEDLDYGIEECTEPNCGYCGRGMMNE